MNAVSQRAEAFKKSVRELKLLDDREIDSVLDQAHRSGLSPIEILVKKGLVTSSDIDVIDLLARSEDAIPGYELLGLIGRGGMGVVYRAKQKALNRVVALKTVLANKATDKLALARFEREAVTIAQLSHPNIVNALDFGQHDGRFYLAMELVEGEDLAEYIEQRGPLPEWAAWGIARQIAAGLLHASRAGVIHRDIKPANILLVKPPEGHSLRAGLPMAKITDFGLAILNSQQIVQERLTSEDAKVGSPNYMAPEQLDNTECDTRVDIYALGATVFHVLAGHPPWSGKSLQQIVGAKIGKERISIADHNARISAETIALLSNMMEPEVERRSRSYEQLMAAMAGLSEESTSDMPTRRDVPQRHEAISTEAFNEVATLVLQTEETPISRRMDRRKLWLMASLGLIFLAAGVGSVWMFSRPVATELVATGEQLRLFDGQNLFSPEITQLAGGWSVRAGCLVHAEGTVGALTFHLPDWQQFAFEANVENTSSNTVTIQFAAPKPDGEGHRIALQLQADTAQLGTLEDWRSEFHGQSKELELDANRAAHAIRVRKDHSNWSASVDGIEVGSIRHSADAVPEITIAVRKQTPQKTQSKEPPIESGEATISEIVVTQLEPAL